MKNGNILDAVVAPDVNVFNTYAVYRSPRSQKYRTDLTDSKVFDKMVRMNQPPIPEGQCAIDRDRMTWRNLTDHQISMTLLGAVVNNDRATAQRARRALNRRKHKKIVL